MAELEEIIIKAIKTVSAAMQIKHVLIGKAVNVTNTTCDVEREDAATLLGVRLNAVDDTLNSYFTVIPAKNSFVVVAILEGKKEEAVVVRCSTIEKIIAKIGDKTMTINKDEFVLNDGKNDGIIKIKELTTKINDLVNSVNAFISLYNTHTHPMSSGATVATTSLATSASTFSPEAYEDKNIKH